MGIFTRTPAIVPVRPRQVTAKRSFAAAALSRLFGAWGVELVAADDELALAIDKLRSRSRDLTQNNPLASAAARAFVENIAGPTGMLCTPQVTNRSGDLRSPLNRKLSAWWTAWGQPGTCTVDGRLSWVDLQRLAVRTWRVDGEFFAIKHRSKRVNRFGYALQPIDADQVDHTYNVRRSATRNAVRMGVEVDSLDRPVAYHIFTDHPSGGLSRTRERVPADRVLHLFEQLRPGQTRGIPAGVAGMARLKMIDQYDQFELGAAQLAAGMAVLFKQAADGPVIQDENGNDLASEIPLTIEAMQGKLLPPGVEPFALSAEHPTSAYESFSRAGRRDVAASYGLAYSTLTGDLTQASYGSLRDGSLKERDLFRGYHRSFATHFCEVAYRDALEQSVLTGAIQLPTENADEWNAVAFSGRGWDWIDPAKDIKATEAEIKLGLTSRQQAAREMGRNYEDVLRETSEDLKNAAEWGVPVHGTDKGPVVEAPDPNDATTEGGVNAGID
jgi:lambda family phage portal protein